MLIEGSVIGIDVGCSPARQSSAICRLDWSASTISWEIERFRAIEPERERIIATVGAGRPVEVAAFDGPLRRGFDIIGRYRTAERMLTRRLGRLIGKPGQSSAPVGKLLNEHANVCAAHISALCNLKEAHHGVPLDDKALVEAFPGAFLGVMIENPRELAARRGDRSDTFFRHLAGNGRLHALIGHLLPGRTLTGDLAATTNHDDRAALVCALSALGVAAGDFVAVGDDDGWIILPPQAFIQSPQWALLEANASYQGADALFVEKPHAIK